MQEWRLHGPRFTTADTRYLGYGEAHRAGNGEARDCGSRSPAHVPYENQLLRWPWTGMDTMALKHLWYLSNFILLFLTYSKQ